MSRVLRWSVVLVLLSALVAPARSAPNPLCAGWCHDGATRCGRDGDCAGGEGCTFEDACLPGLSALIAQVLPEGPGGLNDFASGWTCGLVDCVAGDPAELSFHSDHGAGAVATNDINLEAGARYLVMAEMRADPDTWGYFDLLASDISATSDIVVDEEWGRVTAFATVPATHSGTTRFRLHADGPGFVGIRRIVVVELRDYGVYLRLALLDPARRALFSIGEVVRHREDTLGLQPVACRDEGRDAGRECIDPELMAVTAEAGEPSAWIDLGRMLSLDTGARATLTWLLRDPGSERAIDGGRVRVELAYAPNEAAIVWTGERRLDRDRLAVVVAEGVPSPVALIETTAFAVDGVALDRAVLGAPAAMRPSAFKVGARVSASSHLHGSTAVLSDGLALLAALGLNVASYFSEIPSELERVAAAELGLEHRFIHAGALVDDAFGAGLDLDIARIEAEVARVIEDPRWARTLEAHGSGERLLGLGDEVGGLALTGPAYRQAYRDWLRAEGISADDLGLETFDDALPLESMTRARAAELRPDPADPVAARRFYHGLSFWSEASARAYAIVGRALRERYGSLSILYGADTPLSGVDFQRMTRQQAVDGYLADALFAGRDACHAWQLGAQADYVSGVTAPWREAARARGEELTLAGRLRAGRGSSARKLLELAARGFDWFEHHAYGPYDLSAGADAGGGLGARSRGWLENVRSGSETLARAEPLLHGAERGPSPIVMLASQVDAIWTDEGGPDGEELGWHLGLRQAHYPVDFMLEDEIAQGLLSNPLVSRRVLIIVRKHVSRAAWDAIESWVEGGGTLILGGDLASHDEFGALDAARVQWQQILAEEPRDGGADTIRWATSRGISSFAYGGRWRELVSVAGTTVAVTDDDRTVALRIPRGRGRIYAIGLALGEGYRSPERTCDSDRPAAQARYPTGFSPVMRAVMADLVSSAGVQRTLSASTELVSLHRLTSGDGRPLVLAIPYDNEPLTLSLTISDARYCTFVREELEGVELPLTFGTVLTSIDRPALFSWRHEDCDPPDRVESLPEIAEPTPPRTDDGCAGSSSGAGWSILLVVGLAVRRRCPTAAIGSTSVTKRGKAPGRASW